MKLIYLTSRVPYPLEKGDKLRAFRQIKSLSEKHSITLISLTDKPISKEAMTELSKYCAQIHVFKRTKFSIILNLFKVFFTGKPYQVGYFYDSGIQRKIDKIIEMESPDRIFCQLIRASEYVKNYFHIPKTLDYMDALSKGIERRLRTANFFWRPIIQSEYVRLLRYENIIFDYFEDKIIISEQDRNVIPNSKRHEIRIVPNGVDADFFCSKQQEKKYDLLFSGNMSYLPNVDAAVYIVKNILPGLKRDFPKIRLLIAGTNPTKRVLALRSEHVLVGGWVKNMPETYDSAKIFVAPMQLGTGMQNKLLEAMAMGLPCVTSHLANNAIKAVAGKHIFVAKNHAEYVEQIRELLTNSVLSGKIGQEARQFVIDNYSWEKANETLIL